MAKKDKERVRLSRRSEEEDSYIEDEEELGFFDRLFSPGTIDTDYSGYDDDTQFDGSVDSGTCTDMTGSVESDGFTEDSSTASTNIRFDKELRAKHRSACKNMTVGIYFSFCDFV